MKNIFKTMIIFFNLISLAALAEVYECQLGSEVKYLLALTEDSGLLFANENGTYLKEKKGTLKVLRASDASFVNISFSPTQPEIDWSATDYCWVRGLDDLNFNVTLNAEGDKGSKLQTFLRLITRDNECRIPMPLPARPQNIICQLLK